MTAQPDLFADLTHPLARATDPATSHQAARELRTSGTLSRQLWETLRALAAYPGTPTSAELAAGDTGLRYQYARRLADLEKRGLVEKRAARVCTASAVGKQAHPWAVTPQGWEALG